MTESAAAPPAVAVRLHHGRVVVVLPAATAGRLAALLDQAHALRLRAGHLPIPVVEAFVGAARHAGALAQVVPQSEPLLDQGDPSAAAWLTTAQAASHLGITERAVRKRIHTGRLPARAFGGRWLIDPKELTREAS